MRRRRLSGFLLSLLPLALSAQELSDDAAVPINKWAAPHQILKPQAEERTLTPKLQMPGGLTSDILVFVPVTPCRLADTRPGSLYQALGTKPLVPNVPRTLPVNGTCGIETGTAGGSPEAYSLSVTAVPPAATVGGYLLVYPNPATPVPHAASFTWSPNAANQSGAVTATASADGSVNVVANQPTNVVIDINGYYAAPTDLESNTGLGNGALGATTPDTLGDLNTAFGYQALFSNTNGSNNTAFGSQALLSNIAASGSTAVGSSALSLATGGNNIAIGYLAGSNLKAGSGNILVGHAGTASDNSTIRIGTFQTSTYIAGIATTNLFGGSPVVINSAGQLGVQVTPSSRRYKEDIQDMGDASKGLLQLRPVTFHYKKADPDGRKPLKFGLIAEEVDTVYPELVVRGPDGKVETVDYSKLPAMLLNELQKQYRHAQEQDETIQKLEARLAALEAVLAGATVNSKAPKSVPTREGRR